MNQIVFQTNSLHIGHDKKNLAGPIDIELNSGDCLAVLGRNGSGKSTLLHTICKFIPSISGEIFIDGINLNQLNHRELATKISVVFSGRREVVPQVRVMEILKLGRFPYTGFYSSFSENDKRVLDNVIATLELSHLLDKSIDHLSDGEAQKVFIGRALVQDTPVIIFDEPTTHLDLFNKREIFDLIKSLASGQKTILISTHEIKTAMAISNKCILFGDGEMEYGFNSEMKGKVEKYFGEVLVD